jgi:glycosyltransferase involved in cell wall biosynthesis
MKIALVTHYFDEHLGGIELVAARLAQEWGRAGHYVVWMAAQTSAKGLSAARNVAKMPLRSWNGVERISGLPFPVPGATALLEIWRQVRTSDALVLHDSLYLSNVAAVAAARLLGKPVLVIQHVGIVPYQSRVLRRLMVAANWLVARRVLRAAAQVVYISQTTAAYFGAVELPRPALVLFNGVDTRVFKPPGSPATRAETRLQFGLPAVAPVALFVGRFVEKKGLRVLRQLAQMMPDVTWVFVGTGPLDPAGFGLANVRSLGSLRPEQLAQLYGCADTLVLPSVGEGLPLVMQEALACGLAVVCGSDTALADPRMTQHVLAAAVDLNDMQGTSVRFAAQVREALHAVGAGDSAVARAAFARRQYDWTATANRYLDILDSLRAGRSVVVNADVSTN